jgi:hypothetical protein
MERIAQTADFSQWRQDVYATLDEQIIDFQRTDPIISYILDGYRTELDESQRAQTAFWDIARTVHKAYMGRVGEPPPASGFWYLVRAATVKQLLQDPRPGYDLVTFAQHPSLWKPYIHDMLFDPYKWGELTVDVMGRQLSTNRVSRRNSLLGFMSLARERFGEEVAILDLGCSLNLILKAIALQYPRREVQVMRPNTLRPSVKRTTQLARDILPNAPELGYGYGVDLLDFVKTYQGLSWVKSCPYPREILEETLNPAGPSEFNQLLDAPVPAEQVKLFVGDMTSEAEMSRLDYETGGMRFDVATFIFSAYQTGKAWPEALRLAKQHVRPDGFIFVMGHVRHNPDDKTQLQFLGHWHPHAVRSYVFDLADPNQGWQEVFRSDGRFKKVWLGAGSVALEPEGRPAAIPELFDRANARFSAGAWQPDRRKSA